MGRAVAGQVDQLGSDVQAVERFLSYGHRMLGILAETGVERQRGTGRRLFPQ